jgi:hypothetical protein
MYIGSRFDGIVHEGVLRFECGHIQRVEVAKVNFLGGLFKDSFNFYALDEPFDIRVRDTG